MDNLDEREKSCREELVRVAKLIYEKGYNVTIDGNLSCRLTKDTILITPSGIHKGFMLEEDLIVMDLEGNRIRGDKKPTSESALHTKVYRERPDINSVIHTHSPYAVAATVAEIDLHETYITVAPVPTTGYGRIATRQSADVLGPYIKDYNWAIIPRHGVVAWADSIWNAFLRIEGLEHYAKIIMIASASASIKPLPDNLRDDLLEQWGHIKRKKEMVDE